ncbi:hypothetical protein ACE1CI_11130 [Aerosakkonemataceae cyanobacterium BLCC-F50]|uniref:Uncharacterized protein n=1 Tax=Floridaenema flaviceps BLCC-F50 TaxID=3153642 RepID=A0ABV4XP10_9CYAN
MGYSQQKNVTTNQIITILLNFRYLSKGKLKGETEGKRLKVKPVIQFLFLSDKFFEIFPVIHNYQNLDQAFYRSV